MTTLLLAERPLRDARSRALLADLPGERGETLLLRSASSNWPDGFRAVPPEAGLATLGLSRVLLAGAFLARAHIEEALALAAQAVAAGARLEVRRLTLGSHILPRNAAPQGLPVLDHADAIEARDHATADALLLWRVAAPLTLDPYPERAIAADPALIADLPPGPILGLSMMGGPGLAGALAERGAALQALMRPFQGWTVLPLPVEAPDSGLDDMAGSQDFARALLPDSPILQATRRRPQQVKALAARCAHVVTSQDLVAALAIGAGVPVLGLALGDRRVVPVLSTLANAALEGSNLVYPPPDFASSSARA